ncbi:hypothetical protein [Microbispora hainanensis]|uniref:Uncharacterized protein n=1 Tax=Microbispora hainanensis TaxID=568844 RepID=A0A544YWW5_9ACTN|nr:hypothetical protein [Microbispora hainanensis]TQS21245.1 hypothetical protein FLX08_12255 [Microbispora hainanensis]
MGKRSVNAPDGLTITVPDGPVSIGSGVPGDPINGRLGVVTVPGERAALTATWVATMSAAAGTCTGTVNHSVA